MFLTIEDFNGNFEVTVFSEVLQKARNILKNGSPVLVIGKLREKEGRVKLVADDIFPLQEAVVKLSGGIRLDFSLESMHERQMNQLQTFFEMNHRENGIPVFLNIDTDKQNVNLMVQKFRLQPDKRIISDQESIVGKQNVLLMAAKNNNGRHG